MIVSIKARNCDTVPYTDNRQLLIQMKEIQHSIQYQRKIYACKSDSFRSNGCVETIIAIIATYINSNVIDLLRSHDRINQLKFAQQASSSSFHFYVFSF